MTNHNHTPAPWDDNDKYGNIYHGDGHRRIPVVEGCDDGQGIWVHNEADLDLILAAPDMYEALHKIHGLLGALGDDNCILYQWAHDALKKAQGEQ